MPLGIMAYHEGHGAPQYSADTPTSDHKFGEGAPVAGRYRYTPNEIKVLH